MLHCQQNRLNVNHPKKKGIETQIIKKNKPCKYGEECKRSDCVFYILEKKCQKSLSTKKQKDVRTRMCKYVKKCNKGKNCPFAHDESEIYIPECRYGYKCKKQGKDNEPGECKFSHPPPPPPPEENQRRKRRKYLNFKLQIFQQ